MNPAQNPADPRVRALVFRAGLAIFILGLAVRAGLALATGYQKSDAFENGELYRIADNLARTGTFQNPYICTTGPSAHSAPGYPFVQAPIFWLWGPGERRELARTLLGCLVSAAIYGFLPWLAACFLLSPWVGITAGVLGAALPVYFWIEARGIWDGPWVALCLVIALGFSARALENPTPARILISGVVWGIGFLFGPALLPVFVGALFGFLLYHRLTARALLQAGAAGLIALVVVLPWLIRNDLKLGHWFWIRDDFWLELRISNNDTALPIEGENRGLTNAYDVHPCNRPVACAEVQRLGEVGYFNVLKAAFLDFAHRNPAKLAALTRGHFWYFWFPPLNTWWKITLAALTTLTFFGGTLRMAWRRELAAMWMGAVLLLYPLAYYFVQYDARYGYPIRPVMLLGAGYLLVSLWSAIRSMAPARSPSRGAGRFPASVGNA